RAPGRAHSVTSPARTTFHTHPEIARCSTYHPAAPEDGRTPGRTTAHRGEGGQVAALVRRVGSPAPANSSCSLLPGDRATLRSCRIAQRDPKNSNQNRVSGVSTR